MKQNKIFGLRAVMLIAMLSTAPSTQAQQVEPQAQRYANASVSTNVPSDVTVLQTSHGSPSVQSGATSPTESMVETIKIGTRSVPDSTMVNVEATIAKIQAHRWAGRQAATLYVRNIPVLTFLGSQVPASDTVKFGVTAPPASKESQTQAQAQVTELAIAGIQEPKSLKRSEAAPSSEADDPVSLATQVAAQINQLTQSGSEIGDITVHWVKPERGNSQDRYQIRVAGKPLVTLSSTVLLAGQQRQTETTVLQATNRLRRLIGNASPIARIADKPNQQLSQDNSQIDLGAVRLSMNGMASWYGPGFHGNLSANGEVFNQYGMTAAHKSLPFGTKVRVTNLDNGRSVVVRINDRGPYVGGRIIDLSRGAAEFIGMMGSGVAHVRLDVLN